MFRYFLLIGAQAIRNIKQLLGRGKDYKSKSLIFLILCRIQEMKEENDDEEELESKRRMDEYKDDHKRGEGNRHNRA